MPPVISAGQRRFERFEHIGPQADAAQKRTDRYHNLGVRIVHGLGVSIAGLALVYYTRSEDRPTNYCYGAGPSSEEGPCAPWDMSAFQYINMFFMACWLLLISSLANMYSLYEKDGTDVDRYKLATKTFINERITVHNALSIAIGLMAFAIDHEKDANVGTVFSPTCEEEDTSTRTFLPLAFVAMLAPLLMVLHYNNARVW